MAGRSGVAGAPLTLTGTVNAGGNPDQLAITNPVSGRSSWARRVRISHKGGAGELQMYFNGQSTPVTLAPNAVYEQEAIFSRVALASSSGAVQYEATLTVV